MRLYKKFAVIAESADIINLTLEKREAARFSVETLDAASSIPEDTFVHGFPRMCGRHDSSAVPHDAVSSILGDTIRIRTSKVRNWWLYVVLMWSRHVLPAAHRSRPSVCLNAPL